MGKTATAAARSASTRRLDDPAELELLRADPARLLVGPEPVLVDEWQLYPPSWDAMRRAVDEGPRPGRFLLTGSAAPAGPPTHTGAGRIVPMRMRPLALSERGILPSVSLAALLDGTSTTVEGDTDVTLDDYVEEILAGGFPALRGLPARAQRAHLGSRSSRQPCSAREAPPSSMPRRQWPGAPSGAPGHCRPPTTGALWGE